MKRFSILAILTALTVFGFAQQASAQAVPDTGSLQAFSQPASYMSLAGYYRWQYFKEHNVWISQEKAEESVISQVVTTE